MHANHAISAHAISAKETMVAKGQVRGNRETKKPKKPKEPAAAPAAFAKGIPLSIGTPKKKV